MNFIRLLRFPATIILVTSLMSICSWLIAVFFIEQRAFTLNMPFLGLYVPFLWTLMLGVLTHWGFSLGLKISFGNYRDQENDSQIYTFYKIISVLSWFGFAFSVVKIYQSIGLEGILFIVSGLTLNSIKEALYEDYSVGILSLRYLMIVSGGIALWRSFKRVTIWEKLNIPAFVFYILFYGRRLDLICSIFYFALLYYNDPKLKSISPKKVYTFLFVLISMIIIVSTLRNFNHYDELGISNPIYSTFLNVISYLSAPTQAVVSIGIYIENFSISPQSIDNYLSIFYKSTDLHTTNFFIEYSKIKEEYNANSALLGILCEYGWFGLIIYLIELFILSIFSGLIWKNKNTLLFMGYPILLYAFAEIWRLNLFSGGIFYTLLGSCLVIGLFTFIIYKFRKLKLK